MAIGLDGAALDCGSNAGSCQRIPTIEGAQTTSSVTCRSGSTSHEKLKLRSPCSPSQRCVTSTMATTASQCSTISGTSPRGVVVNVISESHTPHKVVLGDPKLL